MDLFMRGMDMEPEDRSKWPEWMAQALKDIGSSLMLEDNPLSRHPRIQKLAREKYSGRFSPAGFAFKEVLIQCIRELVEEMAVEPGLAKERQFLLLWSEGSNVTQIARELGITRQHCSSTVRRRVIQLLVAKFSSYTLQKPYRHMTTV